MMHAFSRLSFSGMGVVAALGPGVAPGAVNGIDVGKRVTAMLWPAFKDEGQGLWQEYITVPAEALVRERYARILLVPTRDKLYTSIVDNN
jgi:NADPH:quinone reductase-like Zn-dependent oxidoreductase